MFPQIIHLQLQTPALFLLPSRSSVEQSVEHQPGGDSGDTSPEPLLDFIIFSIITRANLCQLVQLGDISPFMSVFHVFSPKLPSLWIFITVRRCLIAAAPATLINTTADR